MQPTQEQWLPVVGYEGYYEVSDQGRIRSLDRVIVDSNGHTRRLNGRILRPARSGAYRTVTLGAKSKTAFVHRIVAATFLGARPDGMEVCHNNGDAGDNRLVNLRYDTASENQRDTRRHGTNANVNKTHCPRGHEYTEANTRITRRNGWIMRACRACRAEDGRTTRAANPRVRKEITHCPQGHPYDEANTYVGRNGSKQCKECGRTRSRRYAARRRNAKE